MKNKALLIVIQLAFGLFGLQAQNSVHEFSYSLNWDKIKNQEGLQIKVTNPYKNQRYIVKNAYLVTKLYFSDDYTSSDNNWIKYELQGSIKFTDGTFSEGQLSSIALQIDNSKPLQLNKIDNIMPDKEIAELNLKYKNLSWGNDFENLDVVLTATIFIEYGVDVKNTSSVSYEVTQNAPVLKQNSVVGLSWETNGLIFPNYQIQIQKLNNYNDAFISPNVIVTKINWDNAINIITWDKKPQANIALGGGSSYYVWRVRPIGNYFEGGINNSKNFGEWSNYNFSTTGNKFVSKEILATMHAFFYVDDVESTKNKMFSRYYTEGDGNIKEQIIYADYLNNPVQTQVYLPSLDKAIVTENAYDLTGRLAISTIPVPIVNSSTSLESDKKPYQYQANLLKNNKGSKINGYLLDNDTISLDSILVDTTNLYNSKNPFSYYSGNNTDKRIASANGLPYTRYYYFNQPDKVVSETTQPGLPYARYDSNYIATGHTTKQIYSIASENELVRMFGKEAPERGTVYKIYNTDPNHTTTISYLNKEGKLIATCLYADDKDTSSLKSLNRNDYTIFEHNEKLSGNIKVGEKMKAFTKIMLANKATLDFKYSVPKIDLNFSCGGLTGDCNYQVSLRIEKSDDNKFVPLLYDIDLNANPQDPHYLIGDIPGGVELDQGEYLITKEIYSRNVNANVDDKNSPLKILNGYISSRMLDNTCEEDRLVLVQDLIKMSSFFKNNKIDSVNAMIKLYNSQATSSTFQNMGLKVYNMPFSNTADFLTDTADINKKGFIKVIMETECCGNLDFTIDLDPGRCSAINSPSDVGFEDYLQTSVGADKDIYNLYFADNWKATEFDQMVFNMLKYKYVEQVTDLAGALHPVEQNAYTCKDLWSSWQGVLEELGHSSENPDKVNFYNEVNNKEGGSGKVESDFDNKKNYKGAGGFFIRWMVRRKISKKVKKKSDADANNTVYKCYLPTRFLEVAGYKFADPILFKKVKVGNSFSSVMINGVEEQDSIAYVQAFTGNDRWTPKEGYRFMIPNEDATENVSKPYIEHSYIKNKFFAFKYYTYTILPDPKYLTGINVDNATKAAKMCEIDNCIEKFEQPDSDHMTDSIRYCMPDNYCQTSYKDWGFNERYAFLQAVMRSEYIPDEDASDELYASTDPYNQMPNSCDALKQSMADTLKVECDSTCEARYDEFRDYVENVFKARCYEVDGCPSCDNSVPSKTIDMIAHRLVEKCKTGFCDIKPEDISCTYERCLMLPKFEYEENYILDLDDCKELLLKIPDWKLSFDVLPKCDTNKIKSDYESLFVIDEGDILNPDDDTYSIQNLPDEAEDYCADPASYKGANKILKTAIQTNTIKTTDTE